MSTSSFYNSKPISFDDLRKLTEEGYDEMMESFEKEVLPLLDQELLPKIKISPSLPIHQIYFQDFKLPSKSISQMNLKEIASTEPQDENDE
jgi:hypothetical protein